MRVFSWAKARLGSIKHPISFSIALLLIIALLVIASNSWRRKPAQISLEAQNDSANQGTSNAIPQGWKVYGGIARPSTDVRLASSQDEKKKPRKKLYKLEGPRPKVPMDANEQTKQVAEALSGKREASAVSPSFVPTSFDAQRFRANQETYAADYAKDIEPGRVFASAQPGEGVPVLRSDGARFHRVNQGERVRLKVDAPAGSPVSFTIFGTGSFNNSLGNITVVADRNGKAETQFNATSGTIGEIPILAASPIASGQVRFVVSVAPKRTRPTGPPGSQ